MIVKLLCFSTLPLAPSSADAGAVHVLSGVNVLHWLRQHSISLLCSEVLQVWLPTKCFSSIIHTGNGFHLKLRSSNFFTVYPFICSDFYKRKSWDNSYWSASVFLVTGMRQLVTHSCYSPLWWQAPFFPQSVWMWNILYLLDQFYIKLTASVPVKTVILII